MLIVRAGLGWVCRCAGVSIAKSVSLFHHVSLGWMLITVQPVGQLLIPRVMVSFVPSSAGQYNVPEVATPETQDRVVFSPQADCIVVTVFSAVHSRNIAW